jgi:hypothetical protein
MVDALAANRRAPNGGSMASLFEGPMFDRKSLPGSNQLLLDWWGDIDAATRLLYVRLALLILAEPSDPAEETRSPLGPSWLLSRYRHAAEDDSPGAERAITGLAGGSASTLDIRCCGRSGRWVCLLSSGTLGRCSDR